MKTGEWHLQPSQSGLNQTLLRYISDAAVQRNEVYVYDIIFIFIDKLLVLYIFYWQFGDPGPKIKI